MPRDERDLAYAELAYAEALKMLEEQRLRLSDLRQLGRPLDDARATLKTLERVAERCRRLLRQTAH